MRRTVTPAHGKPVRNPLAIPQLTICAEEDVYLFLGFDQKQWDAIRLLACVKAMQPKEIEMWLLKNRGTLDCSILVTRLKPDDAMIAYEKAGYPQDDDLWPYINMLLAV